MSTSRRDFLKQGVLAAALGQASSQTQAQETRPKPAQRGPNQKVSVDEALRICTLHGAFASFEEKSKGSITEGKLADFVVLAADPHTVDAERIKDIKVVRTVLGGRTVHPREG